MSDNDYSELLISQAGGGDHPKLDTAVDAAIAAVKEEHGNWYAGIAEVYRPVVAVA
jgi:hypothetical protein